MKTPRERALEVAVMGTLQRHEKFGHPGGSDHATDTVCWLEETKLRAALLVPEALIGDLPHMLDKGKAGDALQVLLDIEDFLDDHADVVDTPAGPAPDKAMQLLSRVREMVGGLKL